MDHTIDSYSYIYHKPNRYGKPMRFLRAHGACTRPAVHFPAAPSQPAPERPA